MLLIMETLRTNLVKCFCGLLALSLFSCNGNTDKQTHERIVNVRTKQVSKTEGVYEKEYIGSIESENTSDLSFQVSGNVNKIYVNEGQSVKKGQLLATVDPSTLQNLYTTAKATLAQTQDMYDRLLVLYNNKSLPEVKYVEIKTSLEQAKSAEQIARKNLSDCKLYAPFSGTIGTRSVEVGANVMPGAPVVSLMNIKTIKVKIAIPENSISSVKIGDPCNVNISALGNKSFAGKVIEKGVVSHPISHTYDIKVQLSNAGKEVMPGMVCKAYLKGEENREHILVPLKSVQIDFANKNYVWVVDADNRAQRKEVIIGDLVENQVIIESGIGTEETIVIEGYQNLSPSVKVQSN